MIQLRVADYCHFCSEFEPVCSSSCFNQEMHTFVHCKNELKCDMLYTYIYSLKGNHEKPEKEEGS